MNFDLLNLYYFKIVAEHENITRAAEYLHISQPALSKSISKLEETIGISLFVREKKRIKLSEAGKLFYPYIARAFDEISNGQLALEPLKRRRENGDIISIASSLSELFILLNGAFLSDAENQNVLIQESVCSQESLIAMLLNNSIDFALTSTKVDEPYFDCTELIEEELVLLVSRDNPLSKKTHIRMEELKHEKLLISGAHYEMDLIVDYCRMAGFSPFIQLYSTEAPVVDQNVKDNIGVGFFPESEYYRRAMHTKLNYSAVHISDVNVVRHIYIVKKAGRKLSNASMKFYGSVIDYYRKEQTEMNKMLRKYMDEVSILPIESKELSH